LKFWLFLLISLIGLFVSSCQRSQPVEKLTVKSTRLDRDLIETSALKNEWRSIRSHILKVDGNALSAQNQAYALYWLGVAQHKLGDVPSAQRSWERALECRPDVKLTEMVRRAFHQKSPVVSRQSPLPSYSSSGDTTKWVLQLGIFSLKDTAENLVNKLNGMGYLVKMRRSEFNGRTSWMVWSGPFSGDDAYRAKSKLQNQGYAAILKNADQFL